MTGLGASRSPLGSVSRQDRASVSNDPPRVRVAEVKTVVARWNNRARSSAPTDSGATRSALKAQPGLLEELRAKMAEAAGAVP